MGTDTGGSIRAPAAFCGITGLKPTFGAVSRHGCVPLSDSMDHVGPMARTAADCAILLAVLAGEDPRDAATLGFRGGDYPAALSGDLTGLTVGVDGDFHARVGVPGGMLALFDAAVSVLESAGARVVEVALPFPHELYAAVRVVMAAEAFEVHRTNLQQRWDRYGRPTRLSLSKGAFIGGADYVRASGSSPGAGDVCRGPGRD